VAFKEILSGLQNCFVRQIDVPERVVLENFFFSEKRFFGDGVFGFNGKDLANAVFQKAVNIGDILQVTMQTSEGGRAAEKFVYHGSGEISGSHVFDLEFGDQLKLETNDILSWRKVRREEQIAFQVDRQDQVEL